MKTFFVGIAEGRLPFLLFWKKSILFMSAFPLAGIMLFPEDFRNLGIFSWNILVVILFLRPIADLFPTIKILRGVLPLRKELGILSGSLGIAHSVGYFLNNKISLPMGIFKDPFWNITEYFFWGILSLLVALVLTITSNIFSMRLLGRHWKKVHRLAYLFFFVTVIHIFLIYRVRTGIWFPDKNIELLLQISALLFLWTLSAKNISFSSSR